MLGWHIGSRGAVRAYLPDRHIVVVRSKYTVVPSIPTEWKWVSRTPLLCRQFATDSSEANTNFDIQKSIPLTISVDPSPSLVDTMLLPAPPVLDTPSLPSPDVDLGGASVAIRDGTSMEIDDSVDMHAGTSMEIDDINSIDIIPDMRTLNTGVSDLSVIDSTSTSIDIPSNVDLS